MSVFTTMSNYSDQDKYAYKNEQIKREYFDYLRGPKGFGEGSIRDYAAAIGQWQLFSNNGDFAAFNKADAMAFKSLLTQRVTKTAAGKLSLTTQYHYLRRVREFFVWLSDRTGYRGKVLKSDAEFLRLSANDMRTVLSGTTKHIPTLEEAKKIIGGIEPKNEVDMRDRALLSLALSSGCRIFAFVSLRMKSFDKRKRRIYQNPGDGVKTKNAKRIVSTFFPIGWDEPERHFTEWYEYLEQKGFGPDDPIFPATRSEIGPSKLAQSNGSVGNAFWRTTGGARKVFKERCKNAGVSYFKPHSFRHFVLSIIRKMPLTEEQKKAVSVTFGHARVATTFESYGHGGMDGERAVEIVQQLRHPQESGNGTTVISEEVRTFLRGLLGDDQSAAAEPEEKRRDNE
jgi:integrase